MSGARRLYLDRAPGELRGVVALDGKPERLLLQRAGEADRPRFGERWRGRVGRRSGLAGGAFLVLGLGPDAVMRGGVLPEGAAAEVEIVAEARAGKGPVAAFRAAADGPPGRLAAAPPLAERLRAFAPEAPVVEGEAAREAADLAEEAILARSHRFGRGAVLTIEPTRALVAVDVDLAGAGDRGGSAAETNLLAVQEAARLLRLKGLGGLVIIDLIGRPKAPGPIIEIARKSFSADQPGAAIGPVGRAGTLEITLPRHETPLVERLCDADGRLNAETVAHRLARRLEAEGRAAPGARLEALAAPEVAAAFSPLRAPLAERLGPRFAVAAEPGRPRETWEVKVW